MPLGPVQLLVVAFDRPDFSGEVLAELERLRESDFSPAPRAGFCLMGACQDCWVQLDTGERLRACTTMLVTGMHVRTGARR